MRYRLNDADVSAEELDGEVIVIHLQSGAYYSLQGTAADIWRGLKDGANVAEVNTALHGDLHEVTSFAEQLAAEGIILPDSEKKAGALVTASSPYARPELQKYTDMQELLLVDPIHEVTEQGWPLAPPKKP